MVERCRARHVYSAEPGGWGWKGTPSRRPPTGADTVARARFGGEVRVPCHGRPAAAGARLSGGRARQRGAWGGHGGGIRGGRHRRGGAAVAAHPSISRLAPAHLPPHAPSSAAPTSTPAFAAAWVALTPVAARDTPCSRSAAVDVCSTSLPPPPFITCGCRSRVAARRPEPHHGHPPLPPRGGRGGVGGRGGGDAGRLDGGGDAPIHGRRGCRRGHCRRRRLCRPTTRRRAVPPALLHPPNHHR